jgi:hypothetical protein
MIALPESFQKIGLIRSASRLRLLVNNKGAWQGLQIYKLIVRPEIFQL